MRLVKVCPSDQGVSVCVIHIRRIQFVRQCVTACPSGTDHLVKACPSGCVHLVKACPSGCDHLVKACPLGCDHLVKACPSGSDHLVKACPSGCDRLVKACSSGCDHPVKVSRYVHLIKVQIYHPCRYLYPPVQVVLVADENLTPV